jgi:2-polyprenyl-6-methoxyphenol hydroxylase-like FAD-dependent oxidoreductase
VSPKALIVGAGIGGLAAGVALRSAGWTVRIHERALTPRELGFGLLLAPNALKALRELGIAGPIEAAGAVPTLVEIRQPDGRLLRRFNARIGGQAIVALRPVLHGALLNAVGEHALELGSEALSFACDGDEVTLRLQDGSTETASVLIGADGIHSVIRKQLHPNEPAPRPSGFTAIRGVAHGAGATLGELGAVGYLGDGIEMATARAGSDAVYWYASLITADVPPQATASEVLAPLLPRLEPALRTIIVATEPDNMRLDPLFRRDPLPAWGEQSVTLLGDAAHPVMPHTGQGAALALEDAVALRRALTTHPNVREGLRQYEGLRRERTGKFIRLGPRIARMTTTHSPLIKALRSAAIRLLPESILRKSPS